MHRFQRGDESERSDFLPASPSRGVLPPQDIQAAEETLKEVITAEGLQGDYRVSPDILTFAPTDGEAAQAISVLISGLIARNKEEYGEDEREIAVPITSVYTIPGEEPTPYIGFWSTGSREQTAEIAERVFEEANQVLWAIGSPLHLPLAS